MVTTRKFQISGAAVEFQRNPPDFIRLLDDRNPEILQFCVRFTETIKSAQELYWNRTWTRNCTQTALKTHCKSIRIALQLLRNSQRKTAPGLH